MKSRVWALLAMGATGLLLAVVMQVASGVQYAIADRQGLDPGYAPTWTVVGTYIGLVLLAVGSVGAAALSSWKARPQAR